MAYLALAGHQYPECLNQMSLILAILTILAILLKKRRIPVTTHHLRRTDSNTLAVLSLLLIGAMLRLSHPATAALTAQEVMDNVLQVYQEIDDYATVVHTYAAESLEASGSLFEQQPPRAIFNLFYRKPGEHAVQNIGKAGIIPASGANAEPGGIFRIELLSSLERFRTLELQLQAAREQIRGQECYVLEITDAEKPETQARLWISPRNWNVVQLTYFLNTIEFVRTQFHYALGNRNRFLPIETRSLFPAFNRVLINRIANYEINTGVPPERFERKNP